MSIFVLEGPDLAGKSTLAGALAELISANGRHATMKHAGPPAPGVAILTVYRQMVEDAAALDASGTSTIFDRMHVGEAIYGPIYRGRSGVTLQDLQDIDSRLDELGAVRVLVDPGDQALIERFRGDRGEDFVHSESELLDIAGQYRILASQLSGWQVWDGHLNPALLIPHS